MLRAIRAVAHGESLLGPTVAQKVLRQFASLPGRRTTIADALTPREQEVLRLIAEARSNREIARELTISVKTVKNHISNIFSKLHVYDRSQAMLYAIRQGLVKID
jgi:NarL family two-component system response regulator LiaR